jgi:hypothetical protein
MRSVLALLLNICFVLGLYSQELDSVDCDSAWTQFDMNKCAAEKSERQIPYYL